MPQLDIAKQLSNLTPASLPPPLPSSSFTLFNQVTFSNDAPAPTYMVKLLGNTALGHGLSCLVEQFNHRSRLTFRALWNMIGPEKSKASLVYRGVMLPNFLLDLPCSSVFPDDNPLILESHCNIVAPATLGWSRVCVEGKMYFFKEASLQTLRLISQATAPSSCSSPSRLILVNQNDRVLDENQTLASFCEEFHEPFKVPHFCFVKTPLPTDKTSTEKKIEEVVSQPKRYQWELEKSKFSHLLVLLQQTNQRKRDLTTQLIETKANCKRLRSYFEPCSPILLPLDFCLELLGEHPFLWSHYQTNDLFDCNSCVDSDAILGGCWIYHLPRKLFLDHPNNPKLTSSFIHKCLDHQFCDEVPHFSVENLASWVRNKKNDLSQHDDFGADLSQITVALDRTKLIRRCRKRDAATQNTNILWFTDLIDSKTVPFPNQ